MKKIVIISTGSFTHIQPYIDFYKQQGHEVSFVAITPSHDRGVETFTLLKKNVTKGRLAKLLYFYSGFKARKIIKRINPDLIHSHYATSGGVVAWLASGKVPYIITAHGSDILTKKNSKLWRFLFDRILKKAEKINVVSDEIEEVIKDWGVSSRKIINASVGIDTGLFKKAGRKESNSESLRFICTRSFEVVYDNATIIRALHRLKENGIDFKMTFVGDGRLLGECQQMVIDFGLDEQVLFTGRIDNLQLPELLNQHDFYISASLSDGTSLCLLEAMASGLIPVVSDIRANQDWIDNDKNGFLFETGSSENLYGVIMKALSMSDDKIEDFVLDNLDLVRKRGDRLVNLSLLFS